MYLFIRTTNDIIVMLMGILVVQFYPDTLLKQCLIIFGTLILRSNSIM